MENRLSSEHSEYWKEVLGYESRYKVSSLGRIFSMKRNKYLSPSLDKDGYEYITLFGERGVKKFKRVNRLIAEHFIENPDNRPQVNHKNHNKIDNRVENLEWCFDHENQRKRSEFRGGKTSKFVGVRFHSEPSNWQARISINNKTYTLGIFKEEEEASEAYLKAYNNYYIHNMLPKN